MGVGAEHMNRQRAYLPPLPPERDALIDAIREAFRDVSRAGGISWSECDVLDGYGSPEECAEARASDKDRHWSELVDDPKWQPFPGMGGFSFIDGIGFRYYLPVTMIRFLMGEITEWYNGHLLYVIHRFVPNSSGMYSSEQLRCIARFVEFMAKYDSTGYRTAKETEWLDALESTWRKYLDVA